MSLSLAHALRISGRPCIAFAGAGGKTTAMFQLAHELPVPVIVTTTTHLGVWQAQLADTHIATKETSLSGLDLDSEGVLLITGEANHDRLSPVNPSLLKQLHGFCKERAISMLIEADGSRQKPLKGWADHEPPIPEFPDLVVQVAGMSGIGKPLTEENIHRADLFSQLSGLEIGLPVTLEALAGVLTHPKGGLKNLPQSARRVALLNQADDADSQSSAQTMAESLLKVYDSVIIASLEAKKIHAVHEPVAGIILAAGESRRFGTPKQLLEWKGQPFVRAVAQTALDAGLSPVVLVTGSSASQVEQASDGLDLQIVRNDEWKDGQAGSIKMGISSLPSNCGGAIFLLADQPQLSTSIIHALKEKHAEGLHPVIAPMILDRRGNPVLFDHETFADLLELEGDIGGRAIFHKYRVEYLPWHDDSLLLDVDTPEQYQRLLALDDL